MVNYNDENDEPELNNLAKLFHKISQRENLPKLVGVLIFICVISVLADLTYAKYGHFAEEKLIGFYALFGFISFSGLILAAKGLRVLIARKENFYGARAIDAEEHYPTLSPQEKRPDNDTSHANKGGVE